MAASLSTESCAAAAEEEAECRDEAAALRLKMVAVASILVAGAAGIAIPLVGRWWRRGAAASSSSGVAFTLAKAFAAGVILATGFVHMLDDANEALTDPCLPESPWRRFPFPGFIAMLAALGTLVADFVTTSLYEGKEHAAETSVSDQETAPMLEAGSLSGITSVRSIDSDAAYAAGDKDPMHIVGMRAHSLLHSHGPCHDTGTGSVSDVHTHGHSHGLDEEPSGGRHIAAAQVRVKFILSAI
jgi:solute carrier family 39 (zinc transporter), member 1/2/3